MIASVDLGKYLNNLNMINKFYAGASNINELVSIHKWKSSCIQSLGSLEGEAFESKFGGF